MNTVQYWKDFWNNYRVRQANQEEDLYFQVGKTINKKPISESVLHEMITRIKTNLDLNQEDIVIDLCCGNGLITYELAPLVKEIVAIDFAEHLIVTARELKNRSNITYIQNDARAALQEWIPKLQNKSIKIVMHDALAYFGPDDLDGILGILHESKQENNILFYVTGVPDDERKWNFYNTEERKKHYLDNADQVANDGMGRWWKKDEIAAVCAKNELTCAFVDQMLPLSNYRMDILISL